MLQDERSPLIPDDVPIRLPIGEVRQLQEQVKTLQTENRALRLENSKWRKKYADNDPMTFTDDERKILGIS